jgi:hypothetical protein
MNLLEDIAEIIRRVEVEFDLKLTDADFADGREEIAHIFLHEACHAALAQRVPWIRDLPQEQHTALDEILARILEDHMAGLLGLPAHTPAEHVRELAMYPVHVTIEQYRHLQRAWREQYSQAGDLPGLAESAWKSLFPMS